MVSGGENDLDGSRILYYYEFSKSKKVNTLKGSSWQTQSTILHKCMVVSLDLSNSETFSILL